MLDMKRQLYQIESSIRIGEFDRGNYGQALEWINKSIDGIWQLRIRQDLSWSLNYKQVYITIGQFEGAKKALQEAIALQNSEEPSAIRGCNLELLGKLYLEWGNIAKCMDGSHSTTQSLLCRTSYEPKL